MKFIVSELAFLLTQREARRNLKALLQFGGVVAAVVAACTVGFHLLMAWEGQQHSWLTGLYWTLTVMSTLGFGDITFHSDLGRGFSILVLLSGIVLLLILLPFTFIRFFYAPWLEAQLRLRAPRELPEGVSDHVVIGRYDEIAQQLIDRLESQGIPHCVFEPDPAKAAELNSSGVRAVRGQFDSVETYRAVRASDARLLVANLDDARNTNLVMTAREVCGEVPIAALAENDESEDVLQLAGATTVLTLKQRLGSQLASRVMVGTPRAHRVGRLRGLVIAEFPVHNTPLAGRSVADTHLRQLTGLNLVATAERGQLIPARSDTVLSDYGIAVVVGTDSQIDSLDAMFVIYEPNENPVIVIGGGRIGTAVTRALKERDVVVHVVERDPEQCEALSSLADRVITGDASDIQVIKAAGIDRAPSVVLTTQDDATNIFLAIYCRRLNPDTRIVTRITHERNLEAIHRAGAEFVMSYSTLAVTSLVALVHGREPVLAGEGVDVFIEPLPEALEGRVLAETGIAEEVGLNVIALQKPGGSAQTASGDTTLEAGVELVMLGSAEQRAQFRKRYA